MELLILDDDVAFAVVVMDVSDDGGGGGDEVELFCRMYNLNSLCWLRFTMD